MRSFVLSGADRRQVLLAAVHVAALVIAIGVAWRRGGPPGETVFWALMIYFCEIAVCGAAEMLIDGWRPARGEADRGQDAHGTRRRD